MTANVRETDDFGNNIPHWHEDMLNQVINDTIIINSTTDLSSLAESGDGLSWNTAYYINRTAFLALYNATNLQIVNSDAYIIFNECYFSGPEFTYDSEINDEDLFFIHLSNSSHIKFVGCEIVGYILQDHEIGVYFSDSSDLIFESCTFYPLLERAFYGENSHSIQILNCYIDLHPGNFPSANYNSKFVECTNSTFINNLISGDFVTLSSSDRYRPLDIYALEFFECDRWNITSNQFEYVENALYIEKNSDFLITNNLFYNLGWGGVDGSRCERITISHNTFNYAKIDLWGSNMIDITKNQFYGSYSGIDLHVVDVAEITQNNFYYLEFSAIDIDVDLSSPQYKLVAIKFNQFYECAEPLQNPEDQYLNSSFNLYFGGVQDLWYTFALCFILFSILVFSRYYGEIVQKQHKSEKISGENSESPSPDQASLPDLIHNIATLAKNQFTSQMIILLLLALTAPLIALGVKQNHGEILIRFFQSFNGTTLYNVLYLDEKFFIWSHIVIALLLIFFANKIFRQTYQSLTKANLIYPIPKKTLFKSIWPSEVAFFIFWLALGSTVNSNGNSVLIVISVCSFLLFSGIIFLYYYLQHRRMRE